MRDTCLITCAGSVHALAVTDWHVWHEEYADPTSSLSRRLGVVRRLLGPVIAGLGPGQRVLSLCAGDGRDVIPVVAARPPERRPELILVELDSGLAAKARDGAAAAGVAATVVVGDAGRSGTWQDHLPADLLMLCGIFGNVSDEDIQRTIDAARSMLTPGGTVIWTRGAFRDRDLRPQVRRWFIEAGLAEVAFECEPHGYGVGVNRTTPDVTHRPLPTQLFAFNR
jgi:hypothetical protein